MMSFDILLHLVVKPLSLLVVNPQMAHSRQSHLVAWEDRILNELLLNFGQDRSAIKRKKLSSSSKCFYSVQLMLFST